MKGRSRAATGLIANPTSRKKAFMQRKAGLMKKLDEITTLCDVKACAVFSSTHDSIPEAWPSKEGVEEVYSEFMKVPVMERTKKMMNHESYMLHVIHKEEGKLKKLRNENREFEIRELALDLIKGKKVMEHHHYDPTVIRDLRFFIDRHLNELAQRIQILTENGESSTLPPFPNVAVADVAPPAVVSDPVFELVQYPNMNMNQQEPVQYQAPADFFDQYLNQNVNQQEPVQYQVPTGFNDQNQQSDYDSMIRDLIQSPNQEQPLMDLFMGGHPPQMGNVEEHASIPSMEDNPYRYYQLSTSHMPSFTTAAVTATADLASTSYMPSFTTAPASSATADDFAPDMINNNHWPTSNGFDF